MSDENTMKSKATVWICISSLFYLNFH